MTGNRTSARVLLISANRDEVNMAAWPLGLACVAATTVAAGHEVDMLDLMRSAEPHAEVAKAVRKFNSDVIGVSVRNIEDQRILENRFFG